MKKRLLITFVLVFVLVFTAVLFTACKDDPIDNETNVEPAEVEPPREEEHHYSEIYTITDDTHGHFCDVHGVVEDAKPHDFERTVDIAPSIRYDSSEKGIEIDYGGYYDRCKVCGHRVDGTFRKGDLDLTIKGDEKAAFVANVRAVDPTSIHSVINMGGVYVNSNGLWFAQYGFSEFQTKVMNSLNLIPDMLVGDYTVYKVGKEYLLYGKMASAFEDHETGEYPLQDVQIRFDASFRAWEMCINEASDNERPNYQSKFRLDEFNLSRDSDNWDYYGAKLEDAENKARTCYQARDFEAPDIRSLLGMVLYYWSPSNENILSAQSVSGSDGEEATYYYYTRSGNGDDVEVGYTYGYMDHGVYYYQSVSEENNNDAYVAEHKTVVSQSDFFNGFEIISELMEELTECAENSKYYAYGNDYDTVYWFCFNDRYVKVYINHGLFYSLEVYTHDFNDPYGHPNFEQNVINKLFGYDCEYRGYSAYGLDTGLNVLWHEHRYSDEYSSDDQYHWHTVLCGHSDATDKEEHQYGEWTVTTPVSPSQNGERTCTCKCGKVKTETIDKNDYTWTYAKTLDIFTGNMNVKRTQVGPDNESIEQTVEVQAVDTTKEAYLAAIASADNPYVAFAEVVTDYSTQSHNCRAYAQGTTPSGTYQTALNKYIVNAAFLSALENSGYTLKFKAVKPVDDNTVVHYAISATGTNLEPLIYYIDTDGFVTIYYYDFTMNADHGTLTLVYYFTDAQLAEEGFGEYLVTE